MNKVAIMYDFDLTLCTKNAQEFALLPALNINAEDFWHEVYQISSTSNMDSILAYMYLLKEYAERNNIPLTREFLRRFGKEIEFFPGVEEYFKRINTYAAALNIELQHYVISSGTKEIIEGCAINDYFTKVFACEYHYDDNGQADWPALAINYTGKTQFLFRINKGTLDVYDNSKINLLNTKREIPFDHMIYIADGFTDVPCMRLVKSNQGYSIAVYSEKKEQTYQQLIKDERVNYVAKADYRNDSELDKILKTILVKIQAEDQLQNFQGNLEM